MRLAGGECLPAGNSSGHRVWAMSNRTVSYILAGVEQSVWPYHASVTVHVDAETLAGRLPRQFAIEPIDAQTCRVQLGSDSPQALAAWLGVLDTTFDIDDPRAHPELIEHLARLAERYRRAAQP